MGAELSDPVSPAPHPDVAVAVATGALAGEPVSGDLAVVAGHGDAVLLAAIDGAGHGPEARAAAERAAALLEGAAADAPLPALVERCHAALAGTRGAALTVARLDVRDRSLTWLAVGNVRGVLVPAAAGAPVSEALLLGGVVGHRLPRLVPVTVPVAPGDAVLLATDGVAPAATDGLRVAGELAPLADGLLRRHRRPADDALVVLARLDAGA